MTQRNYVPHGFGGFSPWELTDTRTPRDLFSTPTPGVTLRGLGESFDDEGFTVYDPAQMYFDPAGETYWSDIATGFEANMTQSHANNMTQIAINAVGPAITADQAAAIAARNGADSAVLPSGGTVRVMTAASPPSNPDPMTWYKVGSQLLHYVGQKNAQGVPIYRSTPLGGALNVPMLAAIGIAAYLFLT